MEEAGKSAEMNLQNGMKRGKGAGVSGGEESCREAGGFVAQTLRGGSAVSMPGGSISPEGCHGSMWDRKEGSGAAFVKRGGETNRVRGPV